MESRQSRSCARLRLLGALSLCAAGMACADEPIRAGGAPRADLLYPVFHIAKSDSYNEVHYAGALGPDCRFAAEPVRVFWLRRTEPQRAPKPLDWMEETFVYGVRLLQVDVGRVTFAIAADQTRPVLLEAIRATDGCHLRARLRILGDWAEPSRAYVTMIDSDLPLPKVSNIELHGRREDGRPLCERLTELRTPGAPCGPVR
jgi:Domain of unknown function (DUF4833)